MPLLTQFDVVQPYSGEYWQAFGYWDFLNFFLDKSSFADASSSSSAAGAVHAAVNNIDFTQW